MVQKAHPMTPNQFYALNTNNLKGHSY